MASGTASTSLPLETYDRADIPLIDTHIHLDSYSLADQESIASALAMGNVQYIITVSMNLPSCKRNLELSRIYGDSIKPAFGYHPEQPLPSPDETEELLRWMENHVQDMVAVGEVGLPIMQDWRRSQQDIRGTTRLISSCSKDSSPLRRSTINRSFCTPCMRMRIPHAICSKPTGSPALIFIGSRAHAIR